MNLRSRSKNFASKYNGVSKFRNKWVAKIRGEYIGVFDTEQEAAEAFNRCAKWLYKERAILNEI